MKQYNLTTWFFHNTIGSCSVKAWILKPPTVCWFGFVPPEFCQLDSEFFGILALKLFLWFYLANKGMQTRKVTNTMEIFRPEFLLLDGLLYSAKFWQWEILTDTDSSNIWWKIFWRMVTVLHHIPVNAVLFLNNLTG